MMQNQLQRALFAITGSAYVITAFMAHVRGLQIDYSGIATLGAVIFSPLVIGIIYCRWRGLAPMVAICETILCGLALVIPIGLSTYLAMGANHPLADEMLVKMDEALGFDWRGFIQAVDASPWLSGLLAAAYSSFSLQLLLLPIILVLTRMPSRAYLMVINYGLICFLSSLVSIWFPALGTYTVYGMDASSLKNINAFFGFAFLDEFHAVRENPDFIFSMSHMKGILTFPSVHAAVATLCVWAAWSIRLLRLPFLVLNLLMATSAISHANHYLVDVMAGILLAATVVAVTSLASARKAQSPVVSSLEPVPN